MAPLFCCADDRLAASLPSNIWGFVVKFLLRLVAVLVIAIVGFAVVSYVLFGENPKSRLMLELDHDLAVGAVTIQTKSKITGCDLALTLTQLDDTRSILEGEKLTIPIKALAAAKITPGRGFVVFKLPEEGAAATCVDLQGTACAKAERREVQLNLPEIQTGPQADRVIGWISELAKSCDR